MANSWRTFALVLCLAALALRPACATTTITLDGTWWQSLSYADKIAAVQGMLAGFLAGYHWAIFQISINTGFQNASQRDQTAVYWIKKTAGKAYNMGASVSFGTIVSKIDAIYRDHPRLLSKSVEQFIVCAATPGNDCAAEVKGASGGKIHP